MQGFNFRKFGAAAILAADGAEAAGLAEVMEIVIEPGEDLLSAMARVRGVSRNELETYLRALANGASKTDANRIAAPASVQ